jgi:predicted nucleotidyltransferase
MNVDLSSKYLTDSKTLFQEMAVLNPNAINKIQSALQFLIDNHVNAVLIGGMAVAHWTTDRKLTPDVDVLTNEMSRIEQILNQNNIEYQPLAQVGNFAGIQVPRFDLDVLDANKGNSQFNQYVIHTARPARIGGVGFKVIDPDVLCIMKFDLTRQRDTEDAFKLLGSGNVRLRTLERHLSAIGQHLNHPEESQNILGYASSMLSS